MTNNTQLLKDIFGRIPRRHNVDNVKEMYGLITEYEDVLIEIETLPAYEKEIAVYFEALDPIKALVKKSTENKASKKQKDDYFGDAATAFKDTMEELMGFYSDK
jgi:hypothetical protein